MHGASDLALFHDRIVSCCYGVISQRTCAIQDSFEFNLLVTTQTWIRRATLGILFDEIFDHPGVKLLGHIPNIKRDTDHICGATGVV